MPNTWPFAGIAPPATAGAMQTAPIEPSTITLSPEHDEMRTLVLRAKTGDTEAFGMLYDRYVELVYRYVFFRVGSHTLAEDLTSDTFLRALRGIADFTWQ